MPAKPGFILSHKGIKFINQGTDYTNLGICLTHRPLVIQVQVLLLTVEV